MDDLAENIKCFLRLKPINQNYLNVSSVYELSLSNEENTLNIKEGKYKGKSFTYDCVFDDNYKQYEVYERIGPSISESFVSGFNCSIFTYGQTGSGKTYTILGNTESLESILSDEDNEGQGLIPRILKQVFNLINSKSNSLYQFRMKCSCLEIYQENLNDLLNEGNQINLKIKEDQYKSMYVDGLIEESIGDYQSGIKHLLRGIKNRHVSSTKMNSESSRSHLVFSLILKQYTDDEQCITSRLNLIDLAGSERVKSTGATGERLKEGGMINKSLSTLGNVINSIVEKKYVPFRDSKLTYLLKDSLGGNSKTIIFGNISQSMTNLNESISTLNFLQRAKCIKNKVTVNKESKESKIIQELSNQIKELKCQISNSSSSHDIGILKIQDLKDEIKELYNIIEDKENIIEDLKNDILLLEIKNQKLKEEYNRIISAYQSLYDNIDNFNKLIHNLQYDIDSSIEISSIL